MMAGTSAQAADRTREAFKLGRLDEGGMSFLQHGAMSVAGLSAYKGRPSRTCGMLCETFD